MAQNNVIHRIRFTPRKYAVASGFFGKYIKLLSGNNLTTLTGKKLKTNGG